jgi:hypothetical protein
MVNTKLELDVQDKQADELDLILQFLRGTYNLDTNRAANPDYSWKEPVDVVKDYLTKVYERFDAATAQYGWLRNQLLVDLVITIPVVSTLIFFCCIGDY